jgi:hypothetical protein
VESEDDPTIEEGHDQQASNRQVHRC